MKNEKNGTERAANISSFWLFNYFLNIILLSLSSNSMANLVIEYKIIILVTHIQLLSNNNNVRTQELLKPPP